MSRPDSSWYLLECGHYANDEQDGTDTILEVPVRDGLLRCRTCSMERQSPTYRRKVEFHCFQPES